MALLTKIGGTGWAAGATALAVPLALLAALFLSTGDAQAENITTVAPALDLNDQELILTFDGNIGGTDVEALSAEITVTFLQAYAVTDLTGDYNIWVFTATVENTSQIDSRVSAFGFDTGGFCSEWAGDVCADDTWDDQLVGVGLDNDLVDTRVVTDIGDGIFLLAPTLYLGEAGILPTNEEIIGDIVYEYDNQGSLPNQFGSLDVCFIMNTNNCSGGGSGGVSTGDTMSFTFVLAFAGSLTYNKDIWLSNFGVRYQSINGCWDGVCYYDESGTGRRAPEPGTLAIMALGLVGIGWSRKRRRRKMLG